MEGWNPAHYIARVFGVDRREPEPVFNRCWPFVSGKEGFFVEVAWTKDGRLIPERSKVLGARAEHIRARNPP